jgi:hypothetical protein
MIFKLVFFVIGTPEIIMTMCLWVLYPQLSLFAGLFSKIVSEMGDWTHF